MFIPLRCVPGYTAPAPDGSTGWMYSAAMISVLQEYKLRFKWVWSGVDAGMDGSAGACESDPIGVGCGRAVAVILRMFTRSVTQLIAPPLC